MLVDKFTKHIAAFKVLTGEEFIASVEYESDDDYIVRKPLTLVATQQGPQFAPFLMMSGDGRQIHIRKNALVAKYTPDESLERSYETVTTGIALPKTGGIIT